MIKLLLETKSAIYLNAWNVMPSLGC